MIELQVRKIQLVVQRVFAAGGRPLPRPHRTGSIAAVLSNPFCGRFADGDEIAAWMDALQPLADEMAIDLRDTLAINDYEIQTYGKGAIVGSSGELEIAAAWHVPGGQSLRNALNSPKAMVPSSKKIGTLGSQIDVPLVYIHASYLRSHYDVQPVVVPDGPRPNEVVYCVVMSTGERPHPRLAGFGIDEVSGTDGLR